MLKSLFIDMWLAFFNCQIFDHWVAFFVFSPYSRSTVYNPHFETCMDTKTLKTIEKNLLEEKQRLEEQLVQFAPKEGSEAYEVNFPQIGDKDDENAAEVDTYSTNLALERTLRSALRDIESALKRIKEGTYGFCKYCDKEIDPKRLVARPVSSACIDCKKRLTQEV